MCKARVRHVWGTQKTSKLISDNNSLVLKITPGDMYVKYYKLTRDLRLIDDVHLQDLKFY